MNHDELTTNHKPEMSEEEKKEYEVSQERIRQRERIRERLKKEGHRGCRRSNKLKDFLD